ncbi:MAG: ORF6N domain-containing protein [Desulfobacteraceae bacterium]|nr:MAG: ORF6N domain-containing protein [Desulfobacteraceae bacterium]
MRESELSVSVDRIERAILVVRGQRVMLDRDLARLYGVQTRVLNQAVRRNLKRFPSDFMFELNREEIQRISQIVTSSGIKFSKRVHAFTAQGGCHVIHRISCSACSGFDGTNRSQSVTG